MLAILKASYESVVEKRIKTLFLQMIIRQRSCNQHMSGERSQTHTQFHFNQRSRKMSTRRSKKRSRLIIFISSDFAPPAGCADQRLRRRAVCRSNAALKQMLGLFSMKSERITGLKGMNRQVSSSCERSITILFSLAQPRTDFQS